MPKNSTKVLYIITKSVWGGAQKHVFDLAHSLPKNDFEVCVAGGPRGVMAEKLKDVNIPYYEIYNFQRDINVLKEFLAFFEILKLLFKIKPDIVHVSSSKAGGIAGVASLIYSALRVPRSSFQTIFTIHGWAFNESRPAWQISLIKFFSKLTCVFYDKIICVSQYDYDCAIKNNIAPAKKMVVIHNGIKPGDYNFLGKEEVREEIAKQARLFRNPFPYDRDARPQRLRRSEVGREETNAPAKLWVGTIGEDTKNKGHIYLTEAIKNDKFLISNIKLSILSGIPDASKYLKSFDIFVLPSLKEGLPYVLLEAGLAEVPVIATNVGGIPEIISPTEGILVPPANPLALADAIKTLAQDPLLRQGYGGRLREKVLTEFSFEKMLGETIKLYKL